MTVDENRAEKVHLTSWTHAEWNFSEMSPDRVGAPVPQASFDTDARLLLDERGHGRVIQYQWY